jgi:methylglyoxal synthase
LTNYFTVALIAHDQMKEELADFAFNHREALKRFHLVATGGTGRLVSRRTGLNVHLLEHGAQGGDQQIGALAASNEVQAVFFFRDPVAAGPHEPDFADLFGVCDTREILLATNRASAEALIYFLQYSPERGAIGARPWGFVLPVSGREEARR